MVEKQKMRCNFCNNEDRFYVWTSGMPYEDTEYECYSCKATNQVNIKNT